MSIEFRDEIKLGLRITLIFAALFSALVGLGLTYFLGIFSHEAYILVSSIFVGEFDRFDDFLGYIFMLLFGVGVPAILVVVTVHTALIRPSHITEIDETRRTVTCKFDLPWMKPYRRSYGFDEVCIRLEYDDEGNRIKLCLPDRWVGLTLVLEPSNRVVEQKFRRLVEMGLPNR